MDGMRGTVVFSHGKDSTPYSRKIIALSDTAQREGYDVLAPDYRGIDSPKARITKLVDSCKDVRSDLVLVWLEPRWLCLARCAHAAHARRVPDGAGHLF